MKKIIIGLCALLLALGFGRMEAQTSMLQDIIVADFHHVVTDLTASVSPINDFNGEACAVIKFFVRDTTFVIEPNLGYIKRESKVGEIRLWVPVGTKRLTVRHEGLFPLKDYIIPEPIDCKKAYHAYLMVNETATTSKKKIKQKEEKERHPQVAEKIVERSHKDTDAKKITGFQETTELKDSERKVQFSKKIQTRFFLGAGYQFTPDPGLSFSLGLNADHHIVEAGATMALSKTDSTYYYSNTTWLSTYSYQLVKPFLRYGYEIRTKGDIAFACTPSLGLQSVLSFGSGRYNERMGLHTVKAYKSGMAMSVSMALRLALCLGKHFDWYVRPEYNIAAYKSDGYKLMMNGHDTFKNWSEGFSMGTGIVVTF